MSAGPLDVAAFLADVTDPTAAFMADRRELVADRKTGRVHQAGAASDEGAAVLDFKADAERSLFVFAKGVLGLDRLTPALHRPLCSWLQRVPPRRKMVLLPRDHLKTSIVSRSLPIHMLIQPKEANAYLAGRDGRDLRILLATETSDLAEAQLDWIEKKFEGNHVLRGLWPHCVWDNARRDTKRWNREAMLIPRTEDFPEASIETVGVAGAVTGHHYDILIKDDLTTLQAANSQPVMETAIQWHEASRALADDPERMLEFIAGTRWAVHDLPGHIIENDPSVDVLVRSVVEDGQPIFPEMFSLATISDLKKRLGTLFPLMYMNEATDPSLVDFNTDWLREFVLDRAGGVLAAVWDADDRDLRLHDRFNAPAPTLSPERLYGRNLYDAMPDLMNTSRGAFLRLRGQAGRPWAADGDRRDPADRDPHVR